MLHANHDKFDLVNIYNLNNLANNISIVAGSGAQDDIGARTNQSMAIISISSPHSGEEE